MELARASLPRVFLALAAVASAGLVLYLGGGQAFFFDEWDLVLGRSGWSVDVFLEPHNEHLFAVPIAALKVVMAAVGLAPHWPFLLPVLAAHLASVVLLYALVSRRLGEWAGVAVAVPVLFLGSAWEDLLLPIQVSFVGSVAAGLAVLVLLDGPSSRRRDVLVAVLLVLSLACSSVGLSFVAAALVEVLARTDKWRRIWIVALPIALYGIWFVAYGRTDLESGGDPRSNVPLIPSYVADSAAGALGAVSGLGSEWGRVLAVAAAIIVVRSLLRAEIVPVRLVSLLVGALTFWTLAAVARGQLGDPAATRYLYVGAVFVLLIGVELWPRARISRVAVGLVGIAVAFALLANLNLLRGGRDTLLVWSTEISARLTALEIVGRDRVAPDFRPAPELAPRLRADEYFAALAEFGSAARAPAALPSSTEDARKAADDVLVRGFFLRTRPAQKAGGRPPSVDGVQGGVVASERRCLRFRATGPGAALEVTVPGPGLFLRTRGSADLTVRRFADTFTEIEARVPWNSAIAVELPLGGAEHPWHARISSQDVVEVCSMPSAGERAPR
jgi:hypothetical protein